MVERITASFRASLYMLLALSTVTIGMAEGRFFPHFLTLPLLVLAYTKLDQRPLLKMEHFTTGVLGLVALLFAFYEFQQGRVNVEMRILAASHLLAYFTWIVLLLEKETQQYWWMLALSVLNLAVSASLTNSASLGLAVVLFLLLSAWTLTLFTVYRGTASLRPVGVGSNVSARRVTPGSTRARRQEHQPLVPINEASRVRGGFHIDPQDNWLGYRLVGNILFLSVASLLVGMCVFTMTPRIWIGNWELPSSAKEAISELNLGKSVAGFTTEVRLGDLGQILDNPTPVMSVEFSDVITGERLTDSDVESRFRRGALLFRGTSMNRYERGGWTEVMSMQPGELARRNAPRVRGGVRINYDLEPIGRPTVFAFHPVQFGVVVNEQDMLRQLRYNYLSQELSIGIDPTSPRKRTIRYETVAVPAQPGAPYQDDVLDLSNLGNQEYWRRILQAVSEAIEEDFQQGEANVVRRRTNFPPFVLNRVGPGQVEQLERYIRELLKFNHEDLSPLVELATELSQENGEWLSTRERCLKIERYLRDSGEFSYTLKMAIQDPEVDPVVDFVLNRKSGHCEYFASALALMLRGVGIPTRLVSGFKGGRWDERRQEMIVEQRHAHAWVEAFVDGSWMVLDPTTARDDLYDDDDSLRFTLGTLIAYFSSFWQNNIIGVSLARQQNDIYDPLLRGLSSAKVYGRNLLGLDDEEQASRTGRKRTWQEYLFYGSVVMFFVIIIAAVLLYFYFRSALYLFGWRFSARRSHPGQKQMLQFFRGFLELSARNGLKKRPQQTAREFAMQFQERFQSALNQEPLREIPLALTNAYYLSRFRGDSLTTGELEHWRGQLDALRAALDAARLANHRSRRKRPS